MIIYTDGSCRSNGKASSNGGFGVVAVTDKGNLIESYREDKEPTTNNEMELSAILYAMKKYGVVEEFQGYFTGMMAPIVYTDSAYALNTLTNWMFNWADNNWTRGPKHKPVQNLKLIQEYYNLYQKGFRIHLEKVKGHSGNKGNELADKLATGELKEEQEIKNFWENN